MCWSGHRPHGSHTLPAPCWQPATCIRKAIYSWARRKKKQGKHKPGIPPAIAAKANRTGRNLEPVFRMARLQSNPWLDFTCSRNGLCGVALSYSNSMWLYPSRVPHVCGANVGQNPAVATEYGFVLVVFKLRCAPSVSSDCPCYEGAHLGRRRRNFRDTAKVELL